MLARLFVFFGGLVVLALTAALVGPYFIDWTSYRADFEREASAILGRKVTVEGSASARLLPFPSVTFTDVSVAGGASGTASMTVDTFSMDVELAPFLRGELLIFDMRLVRPRATVDIAENGALDWAIRPSSPYDPQHVSLEKLTVTDGSMTIRHAASGRNHTISDINAELSAKSLAGPWRATGKALFDGLETELSASTGAAGSDGGMRLRFRADPVGYRLAVEADGVVRLTAGAPGYDGTFKVITKADKPAAGVAAAEVEPGYRLNGIFSASHTRLSIDQFRFESGPLDNPYSADGTASIDFAGKPRFAVTADGAQVRFEDAANGDAVGAQSLADRIAVVEALLADLPRPAIPGSVEVKLPAVVAGDTTIRDVRLSAEPAANGWTLKDFAATLPGRTTLEAAGNLQTEGGFAFSGSLLLAVAQPSGFAAWLSKDVDEAIRRLPAAGFKATVDLRPDVQILSDLELELGGASFRGRLVNRQPADAAPSAALTLAGGELDVEGLGAFAALFVSDKGDRRFAGRDLALAVKAGPVTAAGITADSVDTALRLRDGSIEIDRLAIGGLSGASISATGTVTDYATVPAGKIDATLVSTDLAPLIRLVADRFPGNAVVMQLAARADAGLGLFENARIDLVASLADESDGRRSMALSAQGETGGTALSATLSGSGAADALADAEMSLTVNASNEDATSILTLYGLPTLPLGMTGRGESEIALNGTIRRGMQATASLSGNDFEAKFAGTVGWNDAGVTAKGKADIEAADIEPLMMTLGVGLPGMGTGAAAAMAADIDYADGLLVLAGIDGTLNESALSGDVNATIRNGKPHLTGDLRVDELDLEPLVAAVVGAPALSGDGVAWPATPFQASVSTPVTAELDVAAASLIAGYFATAHDASVSLRLDEEGLSVANLSAKLNGGTITGLFDLKNDAGTGLFTAQLNLKDADLVESLGDIGPSGAVDVSASLSSSGKSVGGLFAGLSGSGTAGLGTLAISGVNPDALGELIASADGVGRDIDAAATARFAPVIAEAGIFEAAPTDATFTIAGGIVRTPPLVFRNPAATMEMTLQADLNASAVSGNGAIRFKAGDEELVGSEPTLGLTLEGRLDSMERVFDTAPMAQFLTQRALEIEQARVEAMQAALLEKQRLRREARYYVALQTERDRLAAETIRLAEQARLQAEAEAKARAEAVQAARVQAAETARLAAEAKAQAEADALAKIEQARRDIEEARRQAVEKARRAAEQQAEERASEAKRIAEQAERQRRAPAVSEPIPGETSGRKFPLSDLFQTQSIDDFTEALGDQK